MFVSGDKVKSVAVTADVHKSEAAGGNRTKSADDSATTGNLVLKTRDNRTEFMMAMALAGN